jgi:hypothetical protein
MAKRSRSGEGTTSAVDEASAGGLARNKSLITCLTGGLSLKSMGAVVSQI